MQNASNPLLAQVSRIFKIRALLVFDLKIRKRFYPKLDDLGQVHLPNHHHKQQL